MLLATTKVADVDRFIHIFSTKGADKRRLHGSNGATVFRDPSEPDRVWAIFDWDAEGWKNFVSDPEVPAILQEAGHVGKPQSPMHRVRTWLTTTRTTSSSAAATARRAMP